MVSRQPALVIRVGCVPPRVPPKRLATSSFPTSLGGCLDSGGAFGETSGAVRGRRGRVLAHWLVVNPPSFEVSPTQGEWPYVLWFSAIRVWPLTPIVVPQSVGDDAKFL